MPASNQKILTACKDTIWVVQKGKVKEALLLGVFHHLKLHRLMGYTSFNEFAWDYFRKSHTTAYETIDYAKVIVTLAAAEVTTFPLKGQALDLLSLGLTQEEKVTIWKEVLVMGAHEKDTQFMAVLKGSKLIDQTKVEALLRKKAISNGRPASKTNIPTQPTEKANRAHLSEIVRTLARPENSELLAAIERASEASGRSVAEFFLEAAREKLERDGERNAAPSDTEAVKMEVGTVSNDPSISSIREEADHAVPPEVGAATACPVAEGTERFEVIYAQTVNHSSSPQGFKTKKSKAKNLRKQVWPVRSGRMLNLKSLI